MKFFATALSMDERAMRVFGLVWASECFTLSLAATHSTGKWRLEVQVNWRKWGALSGASLVVALAQSLCTAVLTISGIRVAIGLSALAAASGIYGPARGFHQDSIRIPMLAIATLGALANLAVLAWIRHLRSRPSAQWRRRELTTKEKRSEKLQVAMAVLTLILVGLETWTHPLVHRSAPQPAIVHSQAT
jgi:formate hydrogenlyase subunit 3/multisubunit Na+/H+ antiporter MnhD subunit